MEIIKFVPTSKTMLTSFSHYLDKQFKVLEEDQFTYQFVAKEKNVISLTCEQCPKHLSVSEVIDTFRHFFSTVVAEYMVEELEQKLIEEMIKQEFRYKQKEQIASIYTYCQQVLFIEEETSLRDESKIVERKCKIFKKAYEYLKEERVFNLKGFIHFRLKDYNEDLKSVIEYAIDEYILEKEYQEFIQLLRYFISIQESKVPLLHVLHLQGRHFVLYNEQGELISESEVECYLRKWTSQKVSYEDIIVSTLISMAPKKIIVHTEEPSNTVIHTLKNIFEEQMTICTSCQPCALWRSQLVPNKVSESVNLLRT